MASQKPVYLVSSNQGGVITQQASNYPSGAVMEYGGIKDKEQKWIPEFGEEPDTVALKCLANDQYMTIGEGTFASINTGAEKTWWKMSYDGFRSPGTFRLSVASGSKEMCIKIGGLGHSTMKLYLEKWDPSREPEYLFAFHFMDADGSPYSSKSRGAASSSEEASAKEKALEEREAALAQKEKGSSAVPYSSPNGDSTEPIYLFSVAEGLALTQQESGRPTDTVMERIGDRDAEQKWIVERGEEPDTIALKSVANKKYLTGEGKHYGNVTTGDKQLWKLEHDGDEVRPPGAYRLSLVGSPKRVFLRHINGSIKVAMHEWTQSNAHYATWYLGGTSTSFTKSRESGERAAASKKALENREAALSQKEKEIADKQKAFEEREASDKQALEDREAALAKKESKTSAKEKALDEREAALSQKEKDSATNKKSFEDREAAWKQQQGNSAASEKSFDDRKAALAQQEKALKNREITLEQREKDSAASKRVFERRKAALAEGEKDFKVKKKALIDREAALAEEENKRTAEWDKKMKELQGSKEASAQAKGNPVGCGSKHYKPPRKLNRKIIGIVYE